VTLPILIAANLPVPSFRYGEHAELYIYGIKFVQPRLERAAEPTGIGAAVANFLVAPEKNIPAGGVVQLHRKTTKVNPPTPLFNIPP
jgi:hypothetical protein